MSYRRAVERPDVAGPPVNAVEWLVIDREDPTNSVVVVAQLAHTAWRESRICRNGIPLSFSEVDVRLNEAT